MNFKVDVLPAGASIESQWQMSEGGFPTKMRFRAIDRPPGGCRERTSAWSEWFDYTGEPVDLTWDGFWP